MALADFVLALCALLGTLLVPFFIMCHLLRLKRRGARTAAAASLTTPPDGCV